MLPGFHFWKALDVNQFINMRQSNLIRDPDTYLLMAKKASIVIIQDRGEQQQEKEGGEVQKMVKLRKW